MCIKEKLKLVCEGYVVSDFVFQINFKIFNKLNIVKAFFLLYNLRNMNKKKNVYLFKTSGLRLNILFTKHSRKFSRNKMATIESEFKRKLTIN